jgi:hypothetical protein
MSGNNTISVRPIRGDNWAYLQDTIHEAIATGVKNIRFEKGLYNISRPMDCENDGKFFSLNLLSEDAAHFDLETQNAILQFNFSEGYGINYQLARSSLIKGLVIKGPGIGADSQFQPFTGIAIDYHNRGNASGSSGILIRECRLRGFTAGICLSPNGVTLNAENIHVEKCSIDTVKVAYATCHRQSKQNTVRDLICWDNVDTVFDGVSYGQCLGNMPYIEGANIAGNVKQVFNYGPQLFSTSANKIFAENLERVGCILDGGVGVAIRDSHFDFNWYKFPEYHFKGDRIKFDNVCTRYYDDQNNKRIVIDGVENIFMNGHADLPFLMKDADRWEEHKRTNYYFNYSCMPESKTKVIAHKDISMYEWLDQQFVDVENKRVVVNDRPHKARVGDYIDTGHPFYPVARIVAIEGNTLHIDNIIDTLTSSQMLAIGINGLK